MAHLHRIRHGNLGLRVVRATEEGEMEAWLPPAPMEYPGLVLLALHIDTGHVLLKMLRLVERAAIEMHSEPQNEYHDHVPHCGQLDLQLRPLPLVGQTQQVRRVLFTQFDTTRLVKQRHRWEIAQDQQSRRDTIALKSPRPETPMEKMLTLRSRS